MDADTKPLILVDGSSYLYRAFHAVRELTTSQGEPTNAIYVVTNMLRRLLKDYEPGRMAVIFDAKGKTFRHEIFPEYKATRPPMPEELAVQVRPLHELVEALGMPILEVPGVEADDVIGTLAHQAHKQGMPVVISTGDKDMAQLVEQGVTLVNTMSGEVLDRDGVVEKFGVPPERIVDYLALIGDKVDNVPGVDKCGPKTAVKWLQEYGSLDAIMARAGEIKGKIGENLREALPQLPRSRELVTIDREVELEVDPEDLQLREPEADRLRALYTRFEFKTLLAELEASDEAGAAVAENLRVPADVDYRTVLEWAELERWAERLAQAPLACLDTETTSLNYMQAELVGLSFCVEPGEAVYVPVAHVYPGAPEQLERERVLERLRPWLEDPTKAKLGQNLKYDRHVLANHGVALQGIVHDTMLESYVLDSTATRHDFDSLAEKYLDHRTIHYEDVAGKGAKQIGFQEVDLAQATPYAAEDADYTRRLHDVLWPRLENSPRQASLYQELEIPLVPVLGRMERNGVLVDTDALREHSGELTRRLHELEELAYKEAGSPFNLGSPKQIQEIFFERLKLPVLRKTPKGQPSTAEDVLEQLALDFPLPRLILEHRGLSKLKSTYTDRLPQSVDPGTGRVHTSYHQAVASTGRLSSSDPNLQNIPVRTEEGRRIRQAFVAPPGRRLLAADYSQIELRIMAHLSGDEGLRRAFAQGLDIHRATAAEVFGLELDGVSHDQRRAAKAINFGLIYGMSAFGLARQLGIERDAAQTYVDLYFNRYPGVRDYMDRTRALAREQGYVETVFGRRLYLPEINSRNGQRRQYAERTAINAPMQGTAADIIKRAMIAVDAWIGESGAPVQMIMQVHDELVFEVDEDALSEVEAPITARMAAAAELAVPLEVSAGEGRNWDEAH
jgi:DNA polymerase-1